MQKRNRSSFISYTAQQQRPVAKGGRTACHRQSAGRHGRWNNEEAARVCAQLVDEIAATKEDVQQEGVTAALADAAVAMASLTFTSSLWRRAAARSERQLCLRANKGIQQQQQPWRAQLSPFRVSGIRVLGKATDQK